jgi:hypothetical protein
MRLFLNIFVGFVFLIVLGCAPADPNKARAKMLFGELDEIAQKPIEHSGEIRQALIRLDEAKKTFPTNRNAIMAYAQMGKEFCTSVIEYDRRTIAIFEELLTLNLVQSNVDCFKTRIQVQNAQIEKMENTLNELELYFDENITDKKTLDQRSSNMREDIDMLTKKYDELEIERKNLCSKSALGVN